MEKIKPITCGRVNPDISESEDVSNSCPVSYRTIRRDNNNNNNRAYLPPLSRALWRMLWTYFMVEEPWVPEWIRDWRGEFDLNTLRVDGELFESGKKKLRIQKYPDTCGRGPKSDISVRSFFHKDLHCGHFCELFEKCIHPQMFWVLDPGNLTFVSRKTAEILLSPS